MTSADLKIFMMSHSRFCQFPINTQVQECWVKYNIFVFKTRFVHSFAAREFVFTLWILCFKGTSSHRYECTFELIWSIFTLWKYEDRVHVTAINWCLNGWTQSHLTGIGMAIANSYAKVNWDEEKIMQRNWHFTRLGRRIFSFSSYCIVQTL